MERRSEYWVVKRGAEEEELGRRSGGERQEEVARRCSDILQPLEHGVAGDQPAVFPEDDAISSSPVTGATLEQQSGAVLPPTCVCVCLEEGGGR